MVYKSALKDRGGVHGSEETDRENDYNAIMCSYQVSFRAKNS